jgi:uncharacterized Zn-binding protein involved in type VI secretion
MGKPAARLGDQTMHGGAVVGPGCPTVLIGKMPAATLGDNHVCPMVTPGTPPIPHVGGPITLGSTGVFIGKKPAARLTDMAVCVGPPSQMIMGSMPVLIGEAGGGGGAGGDGGGGSGGGCGAAGALTSASIAGQPPQTNQVGEHYIEAKFTDAGKLPIGGMRYILTYPDNSTSGGILGGELKRTGVPQGTYTVKLRAITNAQWSMQQVNVGTSVNLIVDTVGVDSGAKAKIDIYVRDGNYADHHLASLEGQVSGDRVQLSWTLQVDEKFLNICDTKAQKKKYSAPFFIYRVTIGDLSEQSGLLYWQDWAEIKLLDDSNKPVANERFKVYLSTGEIREGQLDGSGKKKIEKVPPGGYSVEFPDRLSK